MVNRRLGFLMKKGLEDPYFIVITERLPTVTFKIDNRKMGILGSNTLSKCSTDEIRMKGFYKGLLSTCKILEEGVD